MANLKFSFFIDWFLPQYLSRSGSFEVKLALANVLVIFPLILIFFEHEETPAVCLFAQWVEIWVKLATLILYKFLYFN